MTVQSPQARGLSSGQSIYFFRHILQPFIGREVCEQAAVFPSHEIGLEAISAKVHNSPRHFRYVKMYAPNDAKILE